jgi:hypothetical protein
MRTFILIMGLWVTVMATSVTSEAAYDMFIGTIEISKDGPIV